MTGEEKVEIEIDYDGVIPSGSDWGFSDLSDPKVHPISLIVIDRDGNRASISFDLWEVSRQHQTTFELAEEVHSVAFVPGGTTLASGSGEGVELWDLETRTGTTTSLSGGATAMALSPDGATLASGSGAEVQLLDMASGQVIATFSGHTDPIRSLAFSRDGRDARLGGRGRHPAVGPCGSNQYRDSSGRRRLGGLLPQRGRLSPPAPTMVSGSGTWRPRGRSRRTGTAVGVGSTPLRSHRTEPWSPPGRTIPPCACGTWKRARTSPSSRGMIGPSEQWPFPPTGPCSLPGRTWG